VKKRKRHLSIVPPSVDKARVRELIEKASQVTVLFKEQSITLQELIDLCCDLTFAGVLLSIQYEKDKRGGLKNVNHAEIISDEAMRLLALLQDEYKILKLSGEDEESCFLGGLMYKYYKELERLGAIKIGDLFE